MIAKMSERTEKRIGGKDLDIFPACLFTRGSLVKTDERRWRVLYTKSRQEKAVARQLATMDVPFYLPLLSRVSISRGRKTTSRVPLFSNYLFMFGDEEERVSALATNRLSRVIEVEDGRQIWSDLQQLASAIHRGAPLTKEERLCPGQRVRVRSGQLRGLEGTVVERQGQRRLVVAVNFLQQGASMLLDDCQIEAI
ncbi:transcription termination/antitermination protein NusG [Blastopirellula marina]|uniref:Antitermination protein NusG n=1 Tax=Blastopirellula marina TaxID=124 RepID=A0A2S8G0V4_9BACT|nr:transcription termination/antitermination NusG family protein [Blastopirellula marina]PQO38082.1 antitermination protein NusG [Blastopirellula marina]PTL44738.1 antitermination protein NusG [Blastopirellula marina]